MNANTSWQPRVILQDAVAIGLNGKVSPVAEAGLLSDKSLLQLNRHELTPEGVKHAAEYALNHRIHALTGAIADDLSKCSHKQFNTAIGIAPPGKGAPTDGLYQAFLDKPKDEQRRSVYASLTSTLNQIIAEPEKTLERVAPQAERLRGGWRQSIVGAIDRLEAALFPAGQEPLTPENAAQASANINSNIPEKSGGLFRSLVGTYNAVYQAVVPEIVQNMLAPIDRAILSAVGSITRPVMGMLRDALTTSAPEIENGEALANAAARAVEISMPERLKPIYDNIPTKPIIFVGQSPAYGLKYSSTDGPNPVGMASPGDRAIWIHAGIAATPGHIAREELEHIANDAVGVNEKQLNHAAQHDLNYPEAKAFVRQEAQHNWAKNYPPEKWGMELLNDVNRCFDRLCQTMPPEKAFEVVGKSLPEFGKLFREFRAHEADYISELTFHASNPERGTAILKNAEPILDETKGPNTPPRHLPKDYTPKDASAISALGKGNTTNIKPEF